MSGFPEGDELLMLGRLASLEAFPTSNIFPGDFRSIANASASNDNTVAWPGMAINGPSEDRRRVDFMQVGFSQGDFSQVLQDASGGETGSSSSTGGAGKGSEPGFGSA